jgi:hypothetical protein
MKHVVGGTLAAALLFAAACSGASAASDWSTDSPGVYATTVGVVVDDLGQGPPGVVFIVDRLCADAGDKGLGELTCDEPIPQDGREALAGALERLAPVEFVSDAESVVGEGGLVERDGLLFWLGPVDVEGGFTRVGANYAREISDGRGAGVNLKMHLQDGQWIVDGSAGLGGCPA